MRSLALLLGCFALFALFAHGYLENTDTTVTMQGARAWWLRGKPGLCTAEQAAELAPDTPTWPLEHVVAAAIADPVQPTLGRTGADGLHYVWFPIGHQALLVPCVALGEWFAARFPELEERAVAARGPVQGAQFWAQFFASLLSPLAAAGSVLVLLAFARVLGATPREALGITAVATLCTQFLPGAVETLSNPPGALCLYATALAVARYAAGRGGAGTLLWGGLVASIGVLIRYPLALAVVILLAWAARAAHRRGRVRDLVWLAAGGLPGLAALLAANQWRFADALETGYSASAGFGGFPMWIGLVAILFAPGKGVMWFTPLLWLVVPLALTRRARSVATLVTGAIVVVTLLLYSTVVYWAAGQCWGIRYMTGPIVLLTVAVLVRTTPWRHRLLPFVALSVLGLVISLGGVLTPYPGQQHLAIQAARAVYGDQPNLDNNVNFDPRLSPIHSHWTYVWLSGTGRLDSTRSADTTGPLFGIDVEEPVQPVPVTDRGLRHVWPRWLAHVVPGFPWLLVMLGQLAVGVALLVFGVRPWLRD